MNQPLGTIPPKPHSKGGLFLGLAIALVTPFPVLFLVKLVVQNSEIALLPVLFIGAFQWLYLVPLILVIRKKALTSMVQGLLIGGGVVFLLNAACYGLVFFAFKDGLH